MNILISILSISLLLVIAFIWFRTSSFRNKKESERRIAEAKYRADIRSRKNFEQEESHTRSIDFDYSSFGSGNEYVQNTQLDDEQIQTILKLFNDVKS